MRAPGAGRALRAGSDQASRAVPSEPLKSGTSQASIPIPRRLAQELSDHAARWQANTVLVNATGRQLMPWTLERAMRTARAGVPGLPAGFRYHDLRHYFASMLIASGSDVKVLQARLRHASAKTTLDTYGHLWPDTDDSTRAAIDAVMTARAEGSCGLSADSPGREAAKVQVRAGYRPRCRSRALVIVGRLGKAAFPQVRSLSDGRSGCP
jgi:hypothetical protein